MTANAVVKQSPQWQAQQRSSSAGYIFHEADERWVLDKDSALTVKDATDLLDSALVPGYLGTLSYFATSHSGDYVVGMHYELLHYLRTMNVSVLSPEHLISYRSSRPQHLDYRVGKLRGFIYKWYELGYPGVTASVISLLKGWRIGGNIKGDAVKRRDPEQGPLTDNELSAFNEAAALGFEKGLLSIGEIAMSLLMSATGVRSVQISHLRVGDLDASQKNARGEQLFVVSMPRAKGRGEVFRESFKPYSITAELWAILTHQAKEVVNAFENATRSELQEADKKDLPLFPDWSSISDVESVSDLRLLASVQALHMKATAVNAALRKVVSRGGCYSERTGKMLAVSSRRFRYTTGTRAAREGYGALIIAELLDHRDTQNAQVYIRDIPDHVEALDRAMGHQLAPYAMAFAGVLVDREEDAERGRDPTSRIRYQGAGAGTCGMHGFCGANVPVPCYTCANFQPWLDGPHEELYEWLHKEKERILDITKDETIAAVNDRTILAVAQVIKLCKARREELAEEAENG